MCPKHAAETRPPKGQAGDVLGDPRGEAERGAQATRAVGGRRCRQLSLPRAQHRRRPRAPESGSSCTGAGAPVGAEPATRRKDSVDGASLVRNPLTSAAPRASVATQPSIFVAQKPPVLPRTRLPPTPTTGIPAREFTKGFSGKGGHEPWYLRSCPLLLPADLASGVCRQLLCPAPGMSVEECGEKLVHT